MISRIGILKRKNSMTTAEFRHHWREIHGPLAAQLPGLREYYHHYVTDASQLGIDHARGGWEVDGFSEIVFDSIEDMNAALASQQFQPTIGDVKTYTDDIRLVVCEKHVVVPFDAAAGPAVKRMSILARRPDIDEDRFRHEWRGKHAADVPHLPGLRGYSQNVVLDRYAAMARKASYEDVPVDGIVELWFPDAEAIKTAFASPQATITQTHALSFIDQITTFLVETHRIA